MKTINPPSVWTVPEPFRTIYTHAAEVPAGRSLFVSGQFGVAPDGRMREDFVGQLGQAMDNVEALLAAAGMGRPDIAKATFFLTRSGIFRGSARCRRAGPPTRPRRHRPRRRRPGPAGCADRGRGDGRRDPAGGARPRDPAPRDPGGRPGDPVPGAGGLREVVPVIGREPVPMTADYAQAVRLHSFDLLEREGALVALVETIPGPTISGSRTSRSPPPSRPGPRPGDAAAGRGRRPLAWARRDQAGDETRPSPATSSSTGGRASSSSARSRSGAASRSISPRRSDEAPRAEAGRHRAGPATAGAGFATPPPSAHRAPAAPAAPAPCGGRAC